MMYRKKKNNKAALFFVLLVLVGYIFINFGENVSSGSENKSNYEKEIIAQPEECTTCGPTLEENIVPEDPEINVVMVDEKYTVDITDQVGGDVAGIGSIAAALLNFTHCKDYNSDQLLDSAMRLCTAGSTDIDMKENSLGNALRNLIFGSDTVNVEAISDVKLTLVTYPLALFLGQYVLQDSNRQPNLESPNYPSSGQVIDEDYTLKTHAPKISEELQEHFPETLREDYKVTASADIGGAILEEEKMGEYGVTNVDDAVCDCPPEVSTSDYNPGSPNRQGYAGGGYMRQQSPGGDEYPSMDINQCLELNRDYKMMLFGNVPACMDIPGLVTGFFSGIISKTFGRSTWDDCNSPPELECFISEAGTEICNVVGGQGDCLDTRNIGIKMTPIFGDPYKCEEELCANAYLTNAYKAGLSPTQASAKMHEGTNSEDSLMFFIGTPCKANITVGNFTRDVTVTCLWDASPYLLGYKLDKSTTAPDQEGFPSTFEIYWDLVEQAMDLSAKFYGLE